MKTNNPKKNIPGGWESISIAKVADPSKHWSFTGGPFGSNLKQNSYTESGIRIIQLQNIGDGEFLDDYKVYTSEEKADELISCNIFPGEIILSKMGDPVARACLIPNHAKRYLMASDGIRLAPDPTRFNTYYVLSVINSKDFRAKAENRSTGSTRKRIGLSDLKKITLNIPPLFEQNRIAAILETWDLAIEKLERKIEIKKKNKKSLMQKLFSAETRLSGFKKPWETRQLKEIALLLKGKDLSKEDLTRHGRFEAIHYGELFTLYSEHIDKVISKTNKYINPVVSKKGDVLIPTSDVTPRGLSKACCIAKDGVILGGDILVIRPDPKKLSGLYLSFFLSSQKKYIMRIVSGTTVFHLYGSDLGKMKLQLPEIGEQITIVEILLSANKELEILHQKLIFLKEQKKYLLNKLIAGEIRTPEELEVN